MSLGGVAHAHQQLLTEPFSLYGGVHVAGAGIAVSDVDFYPLFASFSIGAWVAPGIGVELFADRGFDADRNQGFDVELDRAAGVALRLESPPIDQLSGFVSLGYVDYTLTQAAVRGATLEEDFTGMRASAGFRQRLPRIPGLSLTAEYRHYNADEPVRVDALMLGLQFETR